MDLQLPGIDGAEALRQIRDERGRQVPVVAVTAFAMNDDRTRAFESGFDGYVEKPISVRAFLQQVRDFLKLGGCDMNDIASGNPRVLVVDDQPAEHQVARGDPGAARVRRPHRLVRGGGAGRDRRRTTSDLVLLDIVMPGMDGYEVCRAIRERPGHGVPAGRDGHGERRRAEDQGARGRSRRLPDQADQQERAARAGGLAGPDQALPGHHQAPVRRARRVEPGAGGAGGRAGVPDRADGPAAALPLAPAGRADRRLRRRVVPREPPARDRRGVLRPARVHRRSPRRASPRR